MNGACCASRVQVGTPLSRLTGFTRRWMKPVDDHHGSCRGICNERARYRSPSLVCLCALCTTKRIADYVYLTRGKLCFYLKLRAIDPICTIVVQCTKTKSRLKKSARVPTNSPCKPIYPKPERTDVFLLSNGRNPLSCCGIWPYRRGRCRSGICRTMWARRRFPPATAWRDWRSWARSLHRVRCRC